MRTLWAVLAAILTTITGTAILGDLVCEEVRGRLNRLPHTLIRLAVRRVPPEVREDLAQSGPPNSTRSSAALRRSPSPGCTAAPDTASDYCGPPRASAVTSAGSPYKTYGMSLRRTAFE
jgi:hypothetical protein